MTDNEIIKAFEELELYGGFQPKITILIHNAIYLINRQKAEIERLRGDLAFREKQLDNLVKEMTEQSTGYGSSKTEGNG